MTLLTPTLRLLLLGSMLLEVMKLQGEGIPHASLPAEGAAPAVVGAEEVVVLEMMDLLLDLLLLMVGWW